MSCVAMRILPFKGIQFQEFAGGDGFLGQDFGGRSFHIPYYNGNLVFQGRIAREILKIWEGWGPKGFPAASGGEKIAKIRFFMPFWFEIRKRRLTLSGAS